MVAHLNPETEKLVRDELQQRYFGSLDEIILAGIRSTREQSSPPQLTSRDREQSSP
jgi:hypothetical protein